MDIDNKTVLANTFTKGIDADTSDLLISNDSYRMARNLRYITDTEENSGELRLIEGATKLDVGNLDLSEHTVLAATLIRDYGVIITKSPRPTTQPYKFDDDFNIEQYYYYKYFIQCNIEQSIYYTGTSVINYKLRVNANIKYNGSYNPSDVPTPDNNSGTNGYYKQSHLPIILVDITSIDNNTRTEYWDLKNGDFATLLQLPAKKIIFRIAADKFEQPSLVVGYIISNTILGKLDIKMPDGSVIKITDRTTIEDLNNSLLNGTKEPGITLMYRVYNEKDSSTDIYNSYIQFSVLPYLNPYSTTFETYDGNIATKPLYVKYETDKVYVQRINLNYNQNQVKRSIRTSTTPLYNQQDSLYPKGVTILNSLNLDDVAESYFTSQNVHLYFPTGLNQNVCVCKANDFTGNRPNRININDSYNSEYIWNVWRFNNKTGELIKILTCYESIGNNYKNKLSLVTQYEDEDNVKLYIADGEHPILSINIAKQLGEYGGTSKMLGRTTIVEPIRNILTISGRLFPAYVQYAYRLYNKHSVATRLSTLSDMKIINKADRGLSLDENSNVGFRLYIPYNKKDFNNIEIYRITYRQLGQLPTIEMIIDTKFTVNSHYDDVGQSSLLNLSIEEFNSLLGIDIIPREIESKDGYLFASNITYNTSKYITVIENWDAKAMSLSMESNLSLNDQFDFDSWGFGYENDNSNINWKYVCKEFALLPDNNIQYDTTRSLRRGEIYRYGIVLYMNDGYVSQPKWIADIRTPELSDSVRQKLQNLDEFGENSEDGRLLYKLTHHFINKYNESWGDVFFVNGCNLGIEFTVKNLPPGCVGFEIVRCNRSIADRSTITQAVISRLYKALPLLLYDSLHNSYKTTQPKNIIMPTGMITTDPIQYYAIDANSLPLNILTNSYIGENNIYIDASAVRNNVVGLSDPDIVATVSQYIRNDLNGSNYFYLIISPEITYLPDDVKQIFDNNSTINIAPVIKISPELITQYPSTEGRYVSFDSKGWSWYYMPNSQQTLAVIYAGPCDEGDGSWTSDSSKQYYDINRINWRKSDYVENQRNLSKIKLTKLADKVYSDKYNYHDSYNSYSETNILKYAFSKVSQWNLFADEDGNLLFADQSVVVDGYEYINWVFPAYLLEYNDISGDSYIKEKLKSGKGGIPATSRINIGGRCAVISTEAEVIEDTSLNEDHNPFSTYICNIKKPTVPYGGSSTRNDSIFYSNGNYQKVDNTEFNTIEVYDGDTFIRCLEYSATHNWDNVYYSKHLGELNIYYIPFETDINIPNDSGSRYSRSGSVYIQDQPADVNGKFILDKPEYVYNTAYNALSNAVSYSNSSTYYDDLRDEYDYRVCYSNHKTNNEKLDQYVVFQPLNFIDVDTRYGEITELKKFLNKLLYWQKNAVGLLSVNERTQITDDSNLPLILGTGGVLSRYDYLSTTNGMKENQFADTLSDFLLYWWDYDRYEICMYNDGLNVMPLSKSKNIQNYLTKLYKDGSLLESPKLTFDKKYGEIMFDVTSDGCIVYNEITLLFTSVYDIHHSQSLLFTDRLLLLPQSFSLYEWNSKKSNTYTSTGIDGHKLTPYIKFIINDNHLYTKVYDNLEFAGRVYGGEDLSDLNFVFKTPLKQEGRISGNKITNRQYDFKCVIPRAGELDKHGVWKEPEYGDRLRGKTMQCEMSSNSNSLDFSLQYILTKYRISWS